jgi:hypothetical protein
MLNPLLGDVRFALRYFSRHKATTAIIVTVIALGTGANTLIFSTFQAQFLRPAPAVPNDKSHARIWTEERGTRSAQWQRRGFSRPELTAIAERHEIFRDVAAWTEDEVVLDGGDSTGARGVGAQFVTRNFFGVLGVRLSAGQGLLQNNGSAPDLTAVMSYTMAEQLYRDPTAAIGRRIMVNDVPVHIVGVAPPRFQGAMRGMDEPALWLPMSGRSDIARVSPRWLTVASRRACRANRRRRSSVASSPTRCPTRRRASAWRAPRTCSRCRRFPRGATRTRPRLPSPSSWGSASSFCSSLG